METESILLLFLLFSFREDPALKEKVSSFLSFYRDNRDLIAALLGGTQRAQAAQGVQASVRAAGEQTSQDKKSRPLGVGDVLSSYLEKFI